MSFSDEFERVTRSRPCVVCGKPDWCCTGRSGGQFDGAVICARIESQTKWGEAGYLHRLSEGQALSSSRDRSARSLTIAIANSVDMASYSRACVDRLSGYQLEQLASRLALSCGSLERLELGWDGEAWTFPMRNSEGTVTGIRRRLLNGRKLSVKGGRESLFIPKAIEANGHLLICEGPTDTGAVLDLGFHAIGRPSCSGGTRHLASYVRQNRPESVTVVADRGAPGQRGAEKLSLAMRPLCRDVRVISPPEGIGDVRDWVQAGATQEDLLAAIELATPIGIRVVLQGGKS